MGFWPRKVADMGWAGFCFHVFYIILFFTIKVLVDVF
jgi:hypothetical protein